MNNIDVSQLSDEELNKLAGSGQKQTSNKLDMKSMNEEELERLASGEDTLDGEFGLEQGFNLIKKAGKKIGETYTDVAIRPGAAVRAGLQAIPKGENISEAYKKGATAPETVPYFQDIALDNYYKTTDGMIRELENPTSKNIVKGIRDTAGLGVSAMGFIADTASNPFDLLVEMSSFGLSRITKGLTSVQRKAVDTVIKGSDDLRKDKQFIETVTKGISKAIRPSKTGKSTYGRLMKHDANMASAVDSIIDNADKNNRYS